MRGNVISDYVEPITPTKFHGWYATIFCGSAETFPLEWAKFSGGIGLMQKLFIEGGLIRRLWSVETQAYRDHLLRLDAESRRNRFCGGIADDTIRS